MRRDRAPWLLGLLLAGGLIWTVAPAHGLTVCGRVPAVGVAYRIAGAHLKLRMTVHFQDSYGDHQDATLTADWRLRHPPRLGQSNYGLFNGCRNGHGPSTWPYWSSWLHTLPVVAISASWYDSGTDASSPPFSGSCQATFVDDLVVSSAMHGDITTNSGIVTVGRHPKQSLTGYVNTWPSGQCSPDNIDIAADAIQGGLDQSGLAPVRLPMTRLWRTARTVTVPVGVSYSRRFQPYGDKEFDPGATSTAAVTWSGAISFVRGYTCKPNGCLLPPYP